MKKKILILLLAILSLSACKNKNIPQNGEYKYIFNNLVTDKSKDDVKNKMKSSGISQKNIDRFFKQVDFFNANVDNSLLIEKDYKKANEIPEYDIYTMQDDLFDNYPEFAGINCRITTFGLVSDMIKVENEDKINLSAVEIDNSSFKNPPVPTLKSDEINKFNKFYSAIKTNNTGDFKVHLEKIKDFWKENGISFPDSDKYSIISVYVFSSLDENDNELFVGHTGLLFPLNDGRIMLVEKLAFTSPYQAIIFKDRKDLYDYLMKLYDFSSESYPAKPLIFENNDLLKH
jgi:membrane associated protein